MASANVPLVCNLKALSPNDRARRATLAGRLRANTQEVVPTPSGFRLRLVNEPSAYHDALELAVLERRCCGFLRIALELEAANGAVWLVLGGGPDVKALLSTTDLIRGGAVS